MWSGVASLLLLAVVITVSLPPDRLRLHGKHSVFRYWHQVFSVIAIGAAAYHIIASGFYLAAWYQALLLGAVAVLTCFARSLWLRIVHPPFVNNIGYLIASAIMVAAFATIRNFSA
jgi:hypothetical protein